MQSLAGVSSVGTAYTAAQVSAQLFSTQPTQENWLFYRLNAQGFFQSDLSAFVDSDQNAPQIEHDVSRAVKRTLTMQVRGDAGINDLRDLIQPRYHLTMPDGGYLEWKLGVFSASPASRTIQPGQSWLAYQCPDLSQLLIDASFTSTYTVAAGAGYVTSIRQIVATAGLDTPIPVNIPSSGMVLPAALSWDYGTSRLKAITDLLSAISYFPPWIDENGQLRSRQIPDWNTVVPTATFDATSGQAVFLSSISTTVDMSQAYNQVLVIGEDPRRVAVVPPPYVNDSPVSPVSTTNWHPRLLVVRDSSIPDVDTALRKAKALAQQSGRIFSELQPSTLCWPVSQDNDCYRLIYQSPDEGRVDDPYLEVGWRMTCKTGGPTLHRLTALVNS